MTPALVYMDTDGPTPFFEALQAARAQLAGEADADAVLTENQAKQFGTGARVRVPMLPQESESVWRDECLLRPDAEVGVVFYATRQMHTGTGEAASETKTGIWMCGWVMEPEQVDALLRGSQGQRE